MFSIQAKVRDMGISRLSANIYQFPLISHEGRSVLKADCEYVKGSALPALNFALTFRGGRPRLNGAGFLSQGGP